MMPMIPKMSVSPVATRNSNSPYCTPLSTWMRNEKKSTRRAPSDLGGGSRTAPGRCRGPGSHLAAERGVGEGRHRDADDLVLLPLHLAQVDVVDRVVRPREGHRPARAVELRARHRGDHLLPLREVAVHRLDPDGHQLGGV